MKIIKLDSSVYNKIAAGEVVERPASVVKELLENAVDAGADRIEVFVKDGGLDELSVSDNGCGIEKDDLKTAFLPHATSKIRTADDLFSISTLGFRGEALASISSVSMVEIKSKTKDAEFGSYLTLRGGEETEEGAISMNNGTEITVRNLFFNTPARKKFLKTPSGEAAEIKTVCLKTILANPHISVKLSDEKGVVYHSHGNGLGESVRALFSDEICQNLLPVSYQKGKISVSGFVSKSTYFKTNRTYQIAIINGRVAENQSISSAITTVYSQYLMKRNYPVTILSLSIPTDEIDVNVHPTKAEVRFSDNNAVFSAVYHAIKDAVEKDIFDRRMLFQTVNDEVETIEGPNERKESSVFDLFYAVNETIEPIESNEVKREPETGASFAPPFSVEESSPISVFNDDGGVNRIATKLKEERAETQRQMRLEESDGYRVIGQVFGTFLLLEYSEKFIIVDQHAAVERLRYDHLLEEYEKGEIAVQPLLIPATIDVTPSEYQIVSGKIEELKKIGVELIPFGADCFKLLSVPSILSEIDIGTLVAEIVSDRPNKHFPLVHERLAYAACRSSIKGNTYLTNDEIEGLMNAYFKKGLPLQCPHGRPAYCIYTKRDLEKLFKRIV